MRFIQQISNDDTSNVSVGNVNDSKDKLGAPPTMNEDDFKSSMLRNILIWFPISMVFILYFAILALIDMPVQKNSILYAKYGTTKPIQNVAQ